MRKLSLPLVAMLISLAVIAAVMLLTFSAIRDYGSHYDDTRINEVRDTVLSSVAQCYALEGAYPPDLEYLETNYGLIMDRSRYIYHYEKFASNMFPDVKVLLLKGMED
jgi:competence protein ComGC